MLKQCKNRAILFDNVTNNQQKCDAQLKKLLDMVDSVVSSKCGKAFSNLMFAHIKVHELEKMFPNQRLASFFLLLLMDLFSFANFFNIHSQKAHEQKKLHAMGSFTEQSSELRKDRSYDEYLAHVAKMVRDSFN